MSNNKKICYGFFVCYFFLFIYLLLLFFSLYIFVCIDFTISTISESVNKSPIFYNDNIFNSNMRVAKSHLIFKTPDF